MFLVYHIPQSTLHYAGSRILLFIYFFLLYYYTHSPQMPQASLANTSTDQRITVQRPYVLIISGLVFPKTQQWLGRYQGRLSANVKPNGHTRVKVSLLTV